MPGSLRGRLVAAFVAVALTLLVVLGGTLFVVLRGLHADATSASLSDLAGSVLPQVRQSLGSGDLRGTVQDIANELAQRNITVMLVGTDGRLRPIGGLPVGDPVMTTDGNPGDTVRGSVDLDGQRYLYAATVLRRNAALAPKALAFLALDRSGGLALADLIRTLPAVALAILVVAAPLAWLLARSVTRPLDRIGTAAARLPTGGAEPIPLEGPSEVRALTGTFNAMAAELDMTRHREADLLANLRHDLRTPLTVIGGYATALRDGTASGPEAAKAAAAIEEEAGRLARMVEEMGAVERIRSGEDGLHPEPLDVRALLAETASRFATQAQAAGVTLTDRPPGGPAGSADLSLAGDRLALERMLGNLVANALAATGPGGTIRLEAGATSLPTDGRAGTPAVWLGVLDDGPGFPPGGAARAFERFWRGDQARSGSSSGLGLAIVRELAAAHGGSVYAENVTPHGARVGVILPRVAVVPTREAASG